MQLDKIKISNFRQFAGDSTIEFGTGEKNTTLIKGVNGAGKTGIFRAVMFALYGDYYLEQDTTREDIHLVNLNLLKSSKYPVTATVTLYFTHNEVEYRINRSLTEFISDNQITTAAEEAEFGKFLKEEQHFEKITDNQDEVNDEINKILPQNIRKFFFFDAEKLDLLSDLQNGGSVAKKIKSGVYDFLQLSNLNKASKVLGDAARDQGRQLARQVGDQRYEQLEQQIEQANDDLSKLREEKQQLIDEIGLAKKEEDGVKQQIAQNKDERVLGERLKDKQEALKNENHSLSEMVDEITLKIDNFAIDSVLDSVAKAESKVKNIQNQRDDKFSKVILTESLNNKVCALCGNDLKEHPENEAHIQDLLKKFQVSEISGVLNTVSSALTSANDRRKSIEDTMHRNYESMISHENKINKLEQEVEQIGGRITMPQNELKNLSDQENITLPKLQRSISTMTGNIAVKENLISKLSSKLKILEKQQEQVQIKDNNLKIKRLAVSRLKRISDEINRVIETYTDSSRKQLESQMKETFNKIITAQDRSLIGQIKISSNFELSVIGRNGVNMLSDFSMGQSQMLSLAFITSLAIVASKGRDTVDFPLFMDTPFGRLSQDNRINLIENIPDMTSQWILLLTDTELTEGTELPAFKKGNQVGTVYSLKKTDEGTTKIVPEKI